jgi:hypothetical protein
MNACRYDGTVSTARLVTLMDGGKDSGLCRIQHKIMSDDGSCRIGPANDGEERILTLPIRHNRERQSDAKKAESSSQRLNRATLVSGGAS